MQIPDVVIIDDNEDGQPNAFITNCSPQRPLIVVSPGSPQPGYSRERNVPPTPRKGSSDSLSPREKNIAFWRSTSKDSTFSTLDDDEEEEELTRLADQVNLLLNHTFEAHKLNRVCRPCIVNNSQFILCEHLFCHS